MNNVKESVPGLKSINSTFCIILDIAIQHECASILSIVFDVPGSYWSRTGNITFVEYKVCDIFVIWT